jgi:hypothetical protein
MTCIHHYVIPVTTVSGDGVCKFCRHVRPFTGGYDHTSIKTGWSLKDKQKVIKAW